MKIKHLLPIVTLLIITLVACAPVTNPEDANTSEAVVSQSETVSIVCPTGVRFESVKITYNDTTMNDYPFSISEEFLIVPNEGCNLPTKSCTYVSGTSDSGGPSCVVLK